MKTHLPLCLLAVACLLSPFLSAEEKGKGPADDGSNAREVVIVPYDPKKLPGDQQPAQLYLPYERFLELWSAGKENLKPANAATPAPLPYGLSSARYEGRVEERGLTITGTLDLFTGRPWVKVPLPFEGAKVSTLTVDGLAAVWQEGALMVEKAGRHQLAIAFEVARANGATDVRWSVPRSTGTVVTLTLPKAENTALIEPGSGVVERLEGGARIVTAALGATDEVRVRLRTAERTAAAAGPVVATVRETARLTPTWEEFQGDVEFSFPSAVQDHLTVFLAKGLSLTDLSAPNLKSWTLRPDGERQALELVLYEPAKETLTAHLAVQRIPPAGAAARAVPIFAASAGRVELAALSVLAPTGLAVTLTPSGGLRQITQEHSAPGWQLAAAYAGSGSLQYQLAARPPRREAKVEYLYQVGRRQVEIFASMELIANGDPLESLRLDLPPGFEVETLQAARPHNWWRTGGSLVIAFQDETPPSSRVVLHLVQKAPPAATTLEIRSLHLADFHKVTSEVAIAGHKGVDAVLTLPPQATNVPAKDAAANFDVLPPLERKHGFRAATDDFVAQVQPTNVVPKYEAIWAMRAEAHEAWLGISTAVQMNMRQGSIETTRFTLPATLPEARVAGGEVREARSRVEGDLRIYEVGFQNEVSGTVEFTIDLDLPHTGEAQLPPLLFPDATRASGFLVIDNGSEGEMRLANSGVEKTTAGELPWKVASAENAQLFRVPAGAWTMKVTIERLEKAAGRLAFCPWAELSTAFRRDGTTWHKAVWHLQNRALQFLAVRLPAHAELVSVRVAGQSVRADSGVVEGGPALLIPLIKTRPGELSYDVEAVYRVSQPELASRVRRKLEDPDLLGITVERTFWKVWAPRGFEIDRTDGNMERVIEQVALADKLNDAVQELKGLNSIISLSSNGQAQSAARGNFQRLQDQIQRGWLRGNFDNQNAAANPEQLGQNGLSGKQARQQNGIVQRQLEDVNKELNEQVQQLEKKTSQMSAPDVARRDQMQQALTINEGTATLNLGTRQGLAINNTWALNGTTNETANTQRAEVDGRKNVALTDNVIYNNKEAAKKSTGGEKAGGDRLYSSADQPKAGPAEVAQPGKESSKDESPQMAQQLSAARANNGGKSNPQSPINATGAGTLTATGNLTMGNNDVNAMVNPSVSAPESRLNGTNTYTGALTFSGGILRLPNGGVLSTPTTPLASQPTATPKVRGDVQAPADFDTGVANSPDGGMLNPPSPPAATPVPDRRITLAVDFPTEGEPIWFKKIKGAANLEVDLKPLETTHRLRNLAVFVALGFLLAWVRRRAATRPARGDATVPAYGRLAAD